MYKFKTNYLKEPKQNKPYAHLTCTEGDIGHSLAVFREPGKDSCVIECETAPQSIIGFVERDIETIINRSKTLIKTLRDNERAKLLESRVVIF